MKINNSYVLEGDNIKLLDCPKNKKKFGLGNLDTIIIHFTAGGSAESSAKYMARNDIKASAHIVVERDGSIIQLVPFDTISWHAGKSGHNRRNGLNNYSIGIEIANAGKLDDDGKSWFKKQYAEKDIYVDSDGSKWHKYTTEQIEAVKNVCELLIGKYPIKFILGHEDIAPGRKVDPGPAFPLDEFKLLINKN